MIIKVAGSKPDNFIRKLKDGEWLMTNISYPWEMPLVNLAMDALSSIRNPGILHFGHENELLASYQVCQKITSSHSRSFSMAAHLLPEDKKRAIHALYAFCRITDDLVDQPGASAQLFEEWRKISLADHPGTADEAVRACIHTRTKFRIPLGYAQQLLDGVSRDLTQNRYETFEDLALYCYGVASTVGLMYMSIIGYRSSAAVPYAVRLGVALQMTNILRDVAEDWKNNRVYLPREELAQFDLSEDDIHTGIVTDRWRAFMKFQIARIQKLYQDAMPGIYLVHGEGQLALYAAAQFYRGILNDIEAHDYDVFNRRAHVSGYKKLRQIPGLWWKLRTGSLV